MHATFLLERGVGTVIKKLQLNLSTTATLGTEKSGRCREVLNKSQCMDFLAHRNKKKGVAVAESWWLAEVGLYLFFISLIVWFILR